MDGAVARIKALTGMHEQNEEWSGQPAGVKYDQPPADCHSVNGGVTPLNKPYKSDFVTSLFVIIAFPL